MGAKIFKGVLKKYKGSFTSSFLFYKKYTNKLHSLLNSKVNWYQKWHNMKLSGTVHRILFIAFVIFTASLLIYILFPIKKNKVSASNNSVTWTLDEDFNNNAVTTNTETEKSFVNVSDESVQLSKIKKIKDINLGDSVNYFPVVNLKYKPGNTNIAVFGEATDFPGDIHIIDTDTGTIVASLPSPSSRARGINWSFDGNMLVVGGGGNNSEVYIYNTSDSDPAQWSTTPIQIIPYPGTYDAYPNFSSDNQYLSVVWSYQRVLKIYRVSDWQEVKSMSGLRPCYGLDWSGDRGWLALMNDSNQTVLMNTSDEDPTNWSLEKTINLTGTTSFNSNSTKISVGDKIYNISDDSVFSDLNDVLINGIYFSPYNELEYIVTYSTGLIRYFDGSDYVGGNTFQNNGDQIQISYGGAPSGEDFLVGYRSNIELYKRANYNDTGYIKGIIIDAGDGIKADWSGIDYWGEFTYDEDLKFRTRGSNDGVTWPENWDGPDGVGTNSYCYGTSISGCPTTNSSRFLEVEVTLTTPDSSRTPRLDYFTILYNTLDAPTNLVQGDDRGVIATGGKASGRNLYFNADATCGLTHNCNIEFEIKKSAEDFNGTTVRNDSQYIIAGETGTLGYSVSYSGLPSLDEGSYKWRARAYDDSGSVSSWSSYFENPESDAFSIDLNPPKGTIIIENDAKYTKGNAVHLSVNATDAENSVDEMRFSNDGENWSEWESYKEVTTWNLAGTNGENIVYAQFKDSAGNISDKTWITKEDFQTNTGETAETYRENIEITGTESGDISSLKLSSVSVENFAEIKSGRWSTSVAKDFNGDLWVTGENYDGALGLGDIEPRNKWTKTNITNIKKYYAICSNTIVLKNDNTLWITGDNYHGILGSSDQDLYITNWTQILSNVSDFWAGGHSIIAKQSNNTFWAIGGNENGQFGLGDSTDRSTWTQLSYMNNVSNVFISEYSTLVLRNDDSLWGMGRGEHLGLNNSSDFENWQETLDGVDKVYYSQSGSAFVKKKNGEYVVTGNNGAGQLGLGNNANQAEWTNLTGINESEISLIASGYYHTIIVKTNGEIYGSGRNDSGELGLGDLENRNNWTLLPQNNVINASAGSDHSIIIKSDNKMFVTGSNDNGELGLGDTNQRSSFVQSKTPGVYSQSGILGGDGNKIGLRYDAGRKTKWSSMPMVIDWGDWNDGWGILMAVKTSDDGINWSNLYGKDGNAINWDYSNGNWFGDSGRRGTYDDLTNIPDSRYIDIVVKIFSDGTGSMILNSLDIKNSAIDTIIVNNVAPTISFDPNNKYPNENWNVRENVNSVQLRFTTDKNTISYVDYGTNIVSERAGGDPVYTNSHEINIKNLKADNSYKYRLRFIDEIDNMATVPANSDNSGDFYTFTTGKTDIGFEGDPLASNLSQVEITASIAKITWKTKVPTTSWVDYGLDSNYGNTAGDDNLTTTHVVELKNLVAGKTYMYRVRGLDSGDNEFVSNEFSFKAIMKPLISNVKVDKIDSDSAEVSWTTNVKTDSDVAYGETTTYSNRTKDQGYLTVHSVMLENLSDDVTYHFQVEARDEYGNSTKSEDYSFKTPLDTVGPKIENVRIDIVPIESDDTTAQIIVSWKTNKPSTAKIEYGEGLVGGKYEKGTVEDTSLNYSHTSIIKDLKPATSYHFRIVSKDKRSNKTSSHDYNIVTPAKQKSIWQLILKAVEDTFSWVKDMPKFWEGIGKKV